MNTATFIHHTMFPLRRVLHHKADAIRHSHLAPSPRPPPQLASDPSAAGSAPLTKKKTFHNFTFHCSTLTMATRALYTVGFWIRETGQALDRAGCRLQGNYIFREELSRHRPLMNLVDKKPTVAKDAFVAPNASLVGDIQVGSKSSIWYNCVLRGDSNSIRIGSETNIQDHSLVSVGGSRFAPTVIGNKVTVGHGAVLHACTVEDEAFVGMGATLLDGVVVERGAFVAAGAMVTESTRIPAGQIWAGNPAKFLRDLKGNEGAFIPMSADNYSELGAAHAEANTKSFHDLTTVQVKSEEQCPELTAETAPAA